MLKASKAEGDEAEKEIAKHQCYCEDNEVKTRATIDEAEKEIAILESKIEETRASTGILSQEVAEIKARMEAIAVELAKLLKIRTDEKAAYDLLKTDMEEAIAASKNAIDELTSVNA